MKVLREDLSTFARDDRNGVHGTGTGENSTTHLVRYTRTPDSRPESTDRIPDRPSTTGLPLGPVGTSGDRGPRSTNN